MGKQLHDINKKKIHILSIIEQNMKRQTYTHSFNHTYSKCTKSGKSYTSSYHYENISVDDKLRRKIGPKKVIK